LTPHEPPSGGTSVRFIGEEIDQAIARIQERAEGLPRWHRLAVKVATKTLKLCRLRIKMAIGCGDWGPKG
jgi:hypothetical protein